MSAQHTPGPWEMAEAGSWSNGKRTSTEYFVRRPDDDIGIASDIIDPETSEPSEANARLIASAPDLLAALQACIDHGSMTGADWVLDQATAAISKAEGKEEP